MASVAQIYQENLLLFVLKPPVDFLIQEAQEVPLELSISEILA